MCYMPSARMRVLVAPVIIWILVRQVLGSCAAGVRAARCESMCWNAGVELVANTLTWIEREDWPMVRDELALMISRHPFRQGEVFEALWQVREAYTRAMVPYSHREGLILLEAAMDFAARSFQPLSYVAVGLVEARYASNPHFLPRWKIMVRKLLGRFGVHTW